ncbi:glycosyltransferase [Microbacterium sp. ARD31]|uniref:glycosyltransferase n=1 Tax=Microbacterium sp. ARD31 TaxID=2962576 RepID=UPI0028814D1E|nr:glycosyltransferase [Microbacterium sp. ARD31]MDT0185999.1 glycosyltransferase [Microbacterium sp. ARD31]
MTRPDAVAVVVPARDEEVLLPACLDAVAVAVDALRREHPDVRTRVVVVLDACRDASAQVVADRADVRADVRALTTDAACVGVARGAGVDAAASWAAGVGARRLWLASTDADSVVPPDWLTSHLRWATAGMGLVVGTVEPRPGDLDPVARAAWHRRHTLADGHDHVHGANLGLTLAAYRSAGGFPPVPTHEDVRLVAAVRAAGVPHLATGAVPVVTSGRRIGRAPDGFADYLDGLGA